MGPTGGRAHPATFPDRHQHFSWIEINSIFNTVSEASEHLHNQIQVLMHVGLPMLQGACKQADSCCSQIATT